MAIISASRRTDIPAFFPEWFMNRVREGHFYRVNPFNPSQVRRFSLAPAEVELFVFWSKNPRPLMPHLDELDARGYRYYFHFTLNPYEELFEAHLPPLQERIATFSELAQRVGGRRVVWRYDPVILSSATPVSWHLERLESMAAQLEGHASRLMFSFLDFYGKVKKRLMEIEQRRGIRVVDIAAAEEREEMLTFVHGLKRVAERFGLELSSCAEGEALKSAGIAPGSCIDGKLIRELFGIEKGFARDKNQRSECLCVESVDMGMYNTCLFQCAYCYANLGEKTIAANLAKHDQKGPRLISRSSLAEEQRSP